MIAFTNTETTNKDYDIIIENEINSESYCLALLQKFSTMPLSHYSNFINHQISLVTNQCGWLINLEEFIHYNEATFKSKTAVLKYNKIFHLIEQKQIEKQSPSIQGIPFCQSKKLINSECDDRYFSFYETKIKVERIENFTEKIIHLTDEIFLYKQAEKYSINIFLKPYDEQCQQLIEHLQTIRKLQNDFEKEQNNNIPNQLPFKKMRINCNLNQFVDIYYQFSRELFVEGRSIIDGSVNDLVAIIVNSYVDKEGKEISPETVKTLLTPSRTDKRPKPHKRIDIDKML
ncbi:hypothetical protein SAMN05443549_1067 [Flavobacterium fluvii]|uniref:Uncharacterized protein n=2 Tax=Flavobacterium fluvii TaxID=468056 RepID=A0A1M5M174_9FLAO|nr:hypothetical protein SAMN05443549_1067 [Flavobacterium fluvii]